MSYYALVPAAGSGSRMGVAASVPKQYLPLAGRPMIWHALACLCRSTLITRVFVVLAPDDEFWPADEMTGLGPKLEIFHCGGASRAQTVTNGLRQMALMLGAIDNDWILVHDAARPCLEQSQVQSLISNVGEDDAGGILALPVADTMKRADTIEPPRIGATLPREGMWLAQTPQMFRYRVLLEALDFAPQVTDEASAIEALGLRPRLVASDITNLKVTYMRDLHLAELILLSRGNS